jgi:hypothetical protein
MTLPTDHRSTYGEYYQKLTLVYVKCILFYEMFTDALI